MKRLCIEKILTGLSEKIKIPLVFTDPDGKRIMSSVVSDVPIESAKDEITFCKQVPVMANGQLLGNLSSSSKKANLELLLYSAAYCIENSLRLEDEIEDLSAEIINVYQELSLIYSLSNKLGGKLDISSICKQVVEEISSALDVKIILILLHDVKNGMLTVQACTGLEWDKVKGFSVNLATEPFARLFSGKRASVITDQRIVSSLPASPQTALSVPLVTDNRNIGLLIAQDKTSGVEFLSREIKLLDALSGEIAGAIKKAQLYGEIVKKTEDLQKALAFSSKTEFEITLRLGKAAEFRDSETGMHIKRIGEFSKTLGMLAGLSDRACEVLRHSSLLHDVGKIGIPDRILLKPGKLNSGDFRIMQLHTVIGSKILSTAEHYPILTAGQIIALQHHEKWDGSGYPNGVAGKDIHIFSRIVMIVDVFDSLMTQRPYKEAFTLDETVRVMSEGCGTFFDPALLEVFIQHIAVFQGLMEEMKDDCYQSSLEELAFANT